VTIDGVWTGYWIYWILTESNKNNYSVIGNSHTLQFTAARTKSSRSAVSSTVVVWWQTPTMSSASVLTFLPAGDFLTTHSLLPLINSQAGSISQQPPILSRKRRYCFLYNFGTDRIENTSPSNCIFSARIYRTDSEENTACQLLHCLRVTNLLRPLLSNGCCLHSHYQATAAV
jgi:hypothetical protein